MGVFRSFLLSSRNIQNPHVLLFSSNENENKLNGQTFPRKLFGLIVHGFDNVSSIDHFRVALNLIMKVRLRAKFVMKISFHSYANRTNFHIKSFALSLAVRFTAIFTAFILGKSFFVRHMTSP